VRIIKKNNNNLKKILKRNGKEIKKSLRVVKYTAVIYSFCAGLERFAVFILFRLNFI